MSAPTTTSRAREAMGLAPVADGAPKALTPMDRLITRTKSMETAFADAVATGLSPQQLIRDAVTALRNTDKLAECTEASFLGALMTAGQLGLRPNVASLGHGWVLPYWNRKLNDGRGGREAQWILGYQGMVELGYRSKLVQKITAATAYEGDEFRVQRGTDDRLIHVPTMRADERGAPVAHYAVVWLNTGGVLWEYLLDGEVQALRNRMAPTNRQGQVVGPWRDDYLAMARKTALRSLWRWMPKTPAMSMALATDGVVREGLDKDAAITEPEPQTAVVVVAPPAAAPPVAVEAPPAAPSPANEPAAPAPAASDDDSAVFVMPSGERREPMDSNGLRRGLIATIVQRHGPEWEQQPLACAIPVPAEYLTTEELRALANGVTP